MKMTMNAMKAMVAAVAAAVSFAANSAVYHDPGTGFDWAYSVINGNEAMLSNGDGDIPYQYSAISRLSAEGEIAIPAYMDGYRVTAIGPEAFQECSLMTKVTIPDGVTVIGANAFWGCSRLESITLPNSARQIGDYAFLNCVALRSVDLGTGLETLCKSAFLRTGIIDLTLSTSLGVVGSDVFRYCESLTQVTIPGSLNTVGKQMFAQCTSLNSVTISSGVTTIDAYAFADSTSLEYVTIPSTVTAIENNAFRNCPLKTVYVGFGETARVRNLFLESNFDGYATLNIVEEAPVTKTVTFNSNGGTSPNVIRKYVQGSAIVKVPRPKKPGYTYTGWWTAESGGTQISSETVVMDNVTYYAQWETGENKRTVDDDGVYWSSGDAGYEGTVYVNSYYPDTRKNVAIPAAHADGDVFVDINNQFSWGSTKPLESIMIPATIVTIQLNAFGTGSGEIMSFPNLKTVYVNKNDAARIEGLLRGTSYAANVDNLTFVETDPFYFTVTFDVNGGNALATTTKEIEFGAPCGSLPTPTRPAGEHEWQFDGWFTLPSGGEEVTAATILQHQSNRLLDRTLYAHWTELPPDYHTETVGGVRWTYRVVDGAAEIYNDGNAAIPTTTAGVADVPSTLGGYPVTRIGDSAFGHCPLLTRVKIPSGVTSIGNFAFHSDAALRDLSIPSTVTSIAGNAFLAHSIKTIHVEAGDVDRVRALVEAATSSTIYYVVGFPANDDFANAAAIAGASGSVNGSAVGATTEANEPLVALTSAAGNTVWWTWTAPNDCVATFDTAGSNFDTILGVYTGDALGSVAIVAENDDSLAMTPASRSQVSFNAVSDQTYYIAVGAHNWYDVHGSTADITLNWSTYVPPDYASILGAPAGMSFASSGDKPWVAGGTVDEKTTVKSGLETTDDSKSSTLTATFSGAGTLSFWYKVESEQGWDKLEVFIDGGGNCLAGTYKNSGTVDWTKYEYELGAGDHTVVWTYSKDSGGSSESDCAWLADVSFGEVAPPVQHTVTFNGNGGLVAGDVATTTRQVNDGAAVGALPAATRAGYTLTGWFTAASGGTEIETTTPVTADVEYFAHWTPNKYTITFDKNGGDSVSEANRVVNVGEEVGSPLPTATRAGYWSFDGWYTAASGGTQINGSEKVTGDVTYYAHWTSTAPPDYATILGAPAGMMFTPGEGKCWVDAGTEDGKAAVKSGNAGENSSSSVLTATFSGAGTLSFWYKVSSEETFDQLEFFMDGSGNCLAGTYQNSGTVDWTKYEYELGAGDHTVVWKYSKDSRGYAGDDCAWISGVSFGAAAPQPTYTVTFDKNGGDSVTPTSKTVTSGETYGELPTPVWSGHTFDGWFTAGGDKVTADTTVSITADQTLYARWKVLVRFIPGSGSASSPFRYVVVGEKIGTLPTGSYSGHTLIGWFTEQSGGTKVDENYVVNEAQTLYAHWQDNTPTPPPSTWTVTFNPNGGMCSEIPREIDDGEAVGELPTATRTGYTQNGWWTQIEGGVEVTAETAVSADMEIYAHWTPNKYTVTFNANGGDSVAPSSIEVTYDAAYGTLATATRTGYWSFAGWFTAATGGDEVTESTIVKITAGQTLYAHWTDTTPVKYTITFDANGGTGGWSQQLESGAALSAPTVTKTGCTFAGWSPAVPATVPAANTTYTAQWTVNKYTITFDANGGEGGTTVQLDYGAALSAPTVTKTGYAFAGWSPAVPATVPAANATYTAQWTAKKYTITFDANGGTGGTTVQLDYGAALVAPTVTYDGYNFAGWSPEVPATVPAENATYTAQWMTGKFKVTFDPGTDGETSYDSGEFDFEEKLGSVPQATRPGCAFLGWYDAPNGGLEVTPETRVYRSFTAYAHWNENDGDTIYETAVVDGIEWTYKVQGSSVVLYNRGNSVIPLDTVGPVTVPAKLNGRSVISINDRAFYGCASITVVVIPDSVTDIDMDAFAWCKSLQVVQCGKNVVRIGKGAFQFCEKLSAVEFKGTNPILPDDDYSTFRGTDVHWMIFVPKSAKKWPDAWRGKGVNRFPFNHAAPAIDFMEHSQNPKFGKISGSGSSAIGGKYTIKATASKGNAFAGWYDAETGDRVTRTANYAMTLTGEAKKFLAYFVTAEDDIDSLAVYQGDVWTDDDGNVEIDLSAATASYSEPKFTVKGLPSGLKYDSKAQKVTGKATKPGIYKVTVTATNASQKKPTVSSTVEFNLTVPNFTDVEIPVADEYGPFIPGVAVEPVTLVPAAEGCKVTGLPAGMKWTEKLVNDKTLGVIPAYSFYGTPTKPGNYTVTFTKKTADKVKHTATARFVVDRLRTLTLLKSGATGKDDVKGAGNYEANKKVSLKATTDKGKVFSGWFDTSTGDLVDRAANYSYVMPDEDTTLTGVFIDQAEDEKHLDIDIGGFAHYDQNRIIEYDNAVWNETTIEQGVYVEWPVVPNTVSFATIKVSGLPAGMKFTAKDIVDSKTKEVIVPANTIYGAPTAASKPSKTHAGILDPSRVKITMTTAGKIKSEYTLDITVKEMETWGYGTFEGSATQDGDGLATLTVANSGKISGSLTGNGIKWTLTAAYFDDYDETAGQYTATVTLKNGQATDTAKLYVCKDVDDNGKVVGGYAWVGEPPETVANVTQYNWKADPWKGISADFGGTLGFGGAFDETCTGTVTFTFKKGAGTVAIKGEFGSYKPTASANLTPITLPDENGVFYAYLQVYFPANAQKGFAGYHLRVPLIWNGKAFELGVIKP